MNIRKSLSGIDLQRLVESEPFLKAQVEQQENYSLKDYSILSE